MIAKPSTPLLTCILASAFFVFYSLSASSQPSGQLTSHASKKFMVTGLSVQRNGYFRNLMLQDLAMPQQLGVDQLNLEMEYRVSYSINKLNPGTFELRIRPDTIICKPVDYFGFNVAPYVTPHLAGLTFQVVNPYGFVEDSLVFSTVRITEDNDLYFSKTFVSDLADPKILFSSVRPDFDEESYTSFRQDISMIDDYYAASALLTAAIDWTDQMFPSGRETFWNYYLQYFEISRLLNYTESSGFRKALKDMPDPAGYQDLAGQMNRKKIRAITILLRMAADNQANLYGKSIIRDASAYAEWLISYGELARSADHRFGEFYAGLTSLNLYPGLAAHYYMLLNSLLAGKEEMSALKPGLRIAGLTAAAVFEDAAIASRESGDYVMALTWFEDALRVRKAVPGTGIDSTLLAGINSLKMEMAWSYLSLARMAATRSSIDVTEAYLERAREIYSEVFPQSSAQFVPLLEVEQEVYSTYCQKAEELISAGKYSQSLDYLDFLQGKCSECRYDCTGDITRLTTEARAGWYNQLLNNAVNSYEAGQLEDCRQSYDQAVELRNVAGSRITRDRREAELAFKMEQVIYGDYFMQGARYLNYQQYEVALYYLDRARSMESSAFIQADSRLGDYLKEAARPVIESTIEEGRARAMGYFFTESWELWITSKKMMFDYGLADDPDLNRQIDDLEEHLRNYQCEKLRKDYVEMLLDARFKKESGDYIGALDKITRCIGILADDTLCTINDQEAWYLRAQLEYPAEFMHRRQDVLRLIPDDPEGFIAAYDNLYRFYLSMDLAGYGVVFVPFHRMVMQQTDAGFLDGILGYYIHTHQKEESLDILKQLWMTGHQAPSARRQKELATWLAMDDMGAGAKDPIACLNSYVPMDNAYRSFRSKYKYTWLKGSGWKVQYFSLFLKNKSVED